MKLSSIKKISLAVIYLLFSFKALSAQYLWPVTPLDQSHELTGTFCEFRNTLSSDHFHNGIDIPKSDGSPVYSVKDGKVTAIDPNGYNAYVRVQEMAYVHITPNPSLSVGDSVFAGQSVVGTILSGAGHVHFTHGYYNSERNALLEDTGVTPYYDPWAPNIAFVRFYQNKTMIRLPASGLSGPVDIVVKVEERNAPPSASYGRRNNGTYKLGYKILSSDSSTVIYSPPNNGLEFKFDSKPSNGYVHNVFSDQLSTLSSHVYIVTNDITNDNYWNTTIIPSGDYVVMVFTEDTRGNTDTAYVKVQTDESDIIPPAHPELKYVRDNESPIEVGWLANTEEDLLGYRLSYSYDNLVWNDYLNENELNKTMTETSFDVTINNDIYYKLTAVDDAPLTNVSLASDVYGISNGAAGDKILIVDGFDRTESSGSWNLPSHHFSFLHGQAVHENGFRFDCSSNDMIIDETINLSDYPAVIWILADESTSDETFSAAEQTLVKQYLESGGMLFVSGSEIAWDLDQDNSSSGSTIADENFLHNYLHVDYAGDDSEILSAAGVGGTIFEGVNLDYGSGPYVEDWPDYINPYGQGTVVNLKYGPSKNAGIQYTGTFGNGTAEGKLVYLASPLETITGLENRNLVMNRILNFFFPSTVIDLENPRISNLPKEFNLLPNYPNPFNSQTNIVYHLPQNAHVKISVYDINGRLVSTIVNNTQQAGVHRKNWNGINNRYLPAASGLYIVKLSAVSAEGTGDLLYSASQRMILIK